MVAGATVAFGDICYLKSDGEMHFVDADAHGTGQAIGMAIEAGSDGGATKFLFYGFARDDDWAWTIGAPVYATVTGTSTNTLSQTAPTGSADIVQIVGIAGPTADMMFFNPALVIVEIA